MIEVIFDYTDIQTLTKRPGGVPIEEDIIYDMVMGGLIRRKLLAAGIPVIGIFWVITVFKGVLKCEHTPEQLIYRWYDNEAAAKAKPVAVVKPNPATVKADDDL